MSRTGEWLNFFKKEPGEDGGGTLPPKKISKNLWWLTGAALLGIIMIIFGSTGGEREAQNIPENPTVNESSAESQPEHKSKMALEEAALSAKLQDMLEKIDRAGKVSVSVRLSASAREKYAINYTNGEKNTVEKDQGGGTRTIRENNENSQLVIGRNGQTETPVIEMENASKIAGVLVVAGGAANPQVKEQLFQAVQVALNVEPHRILVLPGQGGDGN